MNRIYIALAITAMAFPVLAQGTRTNVQPAGQVSQGTQQFVNKATVGDMYEIQSSKMALDKSQSREVKEFAQKIVDDHSKSSNQLKSIVQQMQGVRVPNQLDAKHKTMIDELQGASGGQFVRRYKDQQISAHNEAIRLYESYSKQGDNEQLKSFAERTLPNLKQHLQLAQNLPEQSGAPGVAQETPRQPAPASRGQAASERSAATQRRAGAAAHDVIATPGPNHIMASDLQGTNVYGANDEDIGEINEIVLGRDGEVVAVVVGVGGFLEIGEKDVAIPFEAIEIQTTTETTGMSQNGGAGDQQRTNSDTGTIDPQRIVLRGMTKQDLENAPEFKANQRQ